MVVSYGGDNYCSHSTSIAVDAKVGRLGNFESDTGIRRAIQEYYCGIGV